MMTNVAQFATKQYLAVANAVRSEEEGQGLVEYALIIALVAIVLVTALTTLEGGIAGTFTRISTSLSPPAAPAP